MRVLIVGENHLWSSETGFARQFRRVGCEVAHWNNKSARLLFAYRDWWRLGRLSRPTYDAIASTAFVRKAVRFRPDLIFIPKGENIHSRAVRVAKQLTQAELVTWYPDHPFKADMTSMNILRNLPRYDVFYIWGKFLEESLRAAGAPRVEYLPFAFDPETHPENVTLTTDDIGRYRCDVCFIGAWDKEREADLEPLSKFGLAIWGPGWSENISGSSPLRSKIRGEGIYNEELVKAYRCSAIVFNHLRRHNGSAHNMRAMEIAGIGGGVHLVRRTPELAQQLFKEQEHLLCFDSPEEMQEKVRTLLRDEARGRSISQAAQEQVKAHHLLSFRIDEILKGIRNSH
jgi:spore maturation protein CgeB